MARARLVHPEEPGLTSVEIATGGGERSPPPTRVVWPDRAAVRTAPTDRSSRGSDLSGQEGTTLLARGEVAQLEEHLSRIEEAPSSSLGFSTQRDHRVLGLTGATGWLDRFMCQIPDTHSGVV
jgi:hypothetical protein